MISSLIKESGTQQALTEPAGSAVRRPKPRLLLIDSNENALKVLAVRLKLAGFHCSIALGGKQALDRLYQSPCDAVLMDLRISQFCGTDWTREIRLQHPATAVILLANSNEAYGAVQGLKDGADECLIKPLKAKDLLRSIRRAIEEKRGETRSKLPAAANFCMDLEDQSRREEPENGDAYENTLLALGTALDLRDSRTAGHSRRVCTYSLEIAQRMECSAVELKMLRQGALLHDIGKLAIPDAILWKPGPLTTEEWNIMKNHVQAGYEMVRNIPLLRSAAELILTHHERHDGTGYPRGLRGHDIPLCSRIFAIADTFDAMTTARPYQGAVLPIVAREEIRRNAGASFDPVVVEAFLAIPLDTLDFIRQTYPVQMDSTVGKFQCGWQESCWSAIA